VADDPDYRLDAVGNLQLLFRRLQSPNGCLDLLDLRFPHNFIHVWAAAPYWHGVSTISVDLHHISTLFQVWQYLSQHVGVIDVIGLYLQLVYQLEVMNDSR